MESRRDCACRFARVTVISLALASAHSASAQSFTVIGKTGDSGLAGGMWPEHSINDSGRVAFNGRFTTGNFQQSLFVGNGAALTNVTPGYQSGTLSFYAVSLTNANRVVADWNQFSNQFVESYDVLNPASPPQFLAQGGTSGFFQSVLIFSPMGNSAGQVALAAQLRGSGASAVATRGTTGYNTLTGFVANPRLSDNGRVLLRTSTEVRLYNYELTSFTSVCAPADGFTGIGGYGLSDDSRVAVFAGTLSTAGADAINTRQAGYHYSTFTPLIPPISSGPGVFVSVAVDGMLDAAEAPVSRVMIKAASPGGDVASLDLSTRPSATNPTAAGGSQLVFAGTGTDGRRKIYTSNIRFSGSANSPTGLIASALQPLISAGQSITGLTGTLTNLSLSDSINNLKQIAFYCETSTGQKAIVRANVDTDGDGLLDTWEERGIDANGDGIIELDLPAMGASPLHKDLFVEIDALQGHALSPSALNMVVAAFAAAPVTNPDGQPGINLHLEVSDTNLVGNAVWATDSSGWAPEFDTLKPVHFGTAANRAAKRLSFRYCIVADRIDDGSLGTAESPGNDFFLTLGEYPGGASVEQQAATFMHELGHTLGLGHGGGDARQGKPNYVSIMNYALVERLPFSQAFWRLDYSREAITSLNESSLNEVTGIPSVLYQDVVMPYGTGPSGQRVIRYVPLNGSPVDWNGDGDSFDLNAVQDLNFLGASAPFADVGTASPGETLNGFDDWANLYYAIGTTGDFADQVHIVAPGSELTGDLITWMRQTFGARCVADFNASGAVSVQDIFDFLAAYFASDPAADVNGSGAVTVQDIFDFLAAYFQGCP